MLNYLKINKRDNDVIENDIYFESEKIIIDPIDYYFSNVIARASKTMFECRREKIKIVKTGTEG